MFWKIYVWFIIVSTIAICIDSILVGMDFRNIIDHLINFVSLLGLFGYVYQKQFFVQLFWKIWLAVDVLWNLISIPYVLDQDDWTMLQSSEGAIVTTVILLLIIPTYAALYRYAFKMKEFWNLQAIVNGINR